MIRDFALIKLTIVTTLRSYSFIFIAVLSCISAFLIPLIISESNSLVNLFQLRIEYSLYICSFLISISSVWTGCSIISADIESYKIHMLIVKPVSKSRVWLDRFCGVVTIHILLLILVSIITYLTLGIMSSKDALSPEEKADIYEKVFTGRKSYIARLDGLGEELSREFREKLRNVNLSEPEKAELEKKIANIIIARRGEVRAGENKTFVFNIEKTKYSDNANVKFILYVGSPDIFERQNRPSTKGLWSVQVNNEAASNINREPQTFLSNEIYDMDIPLKDLPAGENSIKLTYKNLDKNISVFFRINESPKVLIRNTNFMDNYLRYLTIISFGIILLSAIGCALGGMFSFPVAVFVIAAYLLLGSLGNFILSENEAFSRKDDIQLKVGYGISKTLLKVITPVQKFQLSEYISAGMLIETGTMIGIIRKYFLIQFFVISLVGICAFCRRELGMVVQK